MNHSPILRHGGDLTTAIENYGGKHSDWLDLSTGISPWTYPIQAIPTANWRNLPCNQTQLLQAASQYYQCAIEDITATPGSQLSIRLIPLLYTSAQRVAVPEIGYQEHANSWEIAGHTVLRYRDRQALSKMLDKLALDHVVVINPNNPTGDYFTPKFLVEISNTINGNLFVDEAFSDTELNRSMISKLGTPENIVVLKSIGKFFGLAGARIGFVIGRQSIINRLNLLLSPWSLAAPSMQVAACALSDRQWQHQQRERIGKQAERQNALMEGLAKQIPNSRLTNQKLFFSLFAPCSAVEGLHKTLAGQRVWTRLGDRFESTSGKNFNWIRFSLAGPQFDRLALMLRSSPTLNYLNSLS